MEAIWNLEQAAAAQARRDGLILLPGNLGSQSSPTSSSHVPTVPLGHRSFDDTLSGSHTCYHVLLVLLTQVMPQKRLYCKYAPFWSTIHEDFELSLALQRLSSVRALDTSLLSSGFSCKDSGTTWRLGRWWPWKSELENASAKEDPHYPGSCFSWGSHLVLCTATWGPDLPVRAHHSRLARPSGLPAGHHQRLLCSWCPVPPHCCSLLTPRLPSRAPALAATWQGKCFHFHGFKHMLFFIWDTPGHHRPCLKECSIWRYHHHILVSPSKAQGFFLSVPTTFQCQKSTLVKTSLMLKSCAGPPITWKYYSAHTPTCLPCSPCHTKKGSANRQVQNMECIAGTNFKIMCSIFSTC